MPLLLLSPTPRTHRCYLPLMSVLAPHCRPIAVDMPGFGNSDSLPQPLTVETLADTMADFLVALEIEQADVFGLHTGNKLAVALENAHPACVRKLVVAGQSHSIIPEFEGRNKVLMPFYAKYKNHFAESADGSHLVREWLVAQANAMEIWWPRKLLHAPAVKPADIENAEARLIDYMQGWRSCAPMYDAVLAYDLAAGYGRIGQPTLVLELLTEQERHFGGQAWRICELIPGSQSVQLVESDSMALETRPAEFAAAILPFLHPDATAS